MGRKMIHYQNIKMLLGLHLIRNIKESSVFVDLCDLTLALKTKGEAINALKIIHFVMLHTQIFLLRRNCSYKHIVYLLVLCMSKHQFLSPYKLFKLLLIYPTVFAYYLFHDLMLTIGLIPYELF